VNKVFIGGSRRISRLTDAVLRRLDRIIESRLPIVVGDANGVDKAIQRYLAEKAYDRVEVFCSAEPCRNNVGGWPHRIVRPAVKSRSFAFYAAKDRQMALEASVGLMIWDEESVGTLLNVLRLMRQGKNVVVYMAKLGAFREVRGKAGWDEFAAACPSELVRRVHREATVEDENNTPPLQPSLFELPA
jgi:hypothetical protein